MCYEIKNNLLEILKTLVSINTSIDISTMDAVNFIQQIFNDNNLSSFVIPYNNDKDRACFIGSTGNIHEPGLLLSGHLDTYGVSTQLKNWKTNPFKLTIHHDMLIGRGVVDKRCGDLGIRANISGRQARLAKYNRPQKRLTLFCAWLSISPPP